MFSTTAIQEAFRQAPASAGTAASPFAEMEEMELAGELLEAVSEDRLLQFLPRLLRRATAASGYETAVPELRAAARRLQRLTQRLLPGGHGGLTIGAYIDGMELEGLSAEDREFEAARHVVRQAGTAVGPASHALAAVRRTHPPATGQWERQGTAVILHGL